MLVELAGKSRVSYVAPDGHEAANADLAIVGQDLFYDSSTKRFSVAGKAGVASADVPTSLTSAAASAAAVTASPSPTASTSVAPSATPSASPSAVAVASPTPNALALAAAAGTTFAHLDLPAGRQPMFVAKSGERLWVLDDRNQVATIDMGTGEIYEYTSLPRNAQISYWAVGRAYAYALDARLGDLHVMRAFNERVASYGLNFLKPVSSVAVGLDDRLWIGLKDAPYLLAFDPTNGKMSTYDLGAARVSALAVDGLGRIFYVDDSRRTVGTYDPQTGKLNEVTFARSGATTGLVVDRNSTLWLSTSAGEIFSVRGSAATLALGLQRPVTTLALDAAGRAWYLAPLPIGAVGFGYAAADSGVGGQTIAGPASSLAFSALGRAWLADPRGGFYVGRSQP